MLNPPPSDDIDTNSFAYKQWFYMLWTSVSTTVVSAANSFIQLGVGAVTRTIQDKARDIISVKDFGAVGDGVADDTVAIQAACNSFSSSGGTVYMPSGIYNVSSPITFSKSITLVGAGVASTIIKTSSSTGNVIVFDIAYCMVKGIQFNSSVIRTAGAYIKMTINVSASRVRDFLMINGFTGFECICCNSIWIDTGEIFNTVINGYGIRFLGDGVTPAGNDLYVNKVTMSGNANLATAGIQITNNGAINITDCDIIRHGRDISIEPGNGEVATAVYVLNTYFDTATHGAWLVPTGTGTIQGVRFVGCWFGSHTGYGLVIGFAGTVGGTELISPQIFGNTTGAILLNGGVDFHCIGGALGSVSAGTTAGVQVAANVSTFHFLGTRIGNGYLKPGFATGINIAAGTSANYSIVDCDLSGNTTAISNSSTGGFCVIENNIGYAIGITSVIGTTYTVLGQDKNLVANVASSCTFTLPTPSSATGRQLIIKSVFSAVISASSNVVPIGGGAASTAILLSGGKFAKLISDGTSWQTMSAN